MRAHRYITWCYGFTNFDKFVAKQINIIKENKKLNQIPQKATNNEDVL